MRTTEDQGSVVRFILWARGLNARDTHNETSPIYGWERVRR
jgi:hypothetical protein